MAQTTISFELDEKLKNDMEQVCDELGMSVATAFTIFVKKVSREQRIPFEIEIDPFYSEENLKLLLQDIEDARSGKAVLTQRELIEVDDD